MIIIRLKRKEAEGWKNMDISSSERINKKSIVYSEALLEMGAKE